MGEDILRYEPADGPPQETERSTAEITAQQLHELIRSPAHDELEPELELVAGVPEHRPEATPIHLAHGSSLRFAHTMRRFPPSDAVPVLAQADVETRPVAMPLELPPVDVPQNEPQDEPALVGGPPRRPFAPRTGRDRLVLPIAGILLALGAVAFLLLR